MVRDLKTYPKKHFFNSYFELSLEDELKDTFILPIAVCHKGLTSAVDVITNPYSDNYNGAVEYPMCHLESRVDKVRIELNYSMPVAGQETGIQAVRGKIGMIAVSHEDLEKDDKVGGEVLDTILGLKEHASGDYCDAIYNGTDIGTEDMFPTANSYFSLTTDARPEGVTFDYDNYVKAMRESSLSRLISSRTNGGLRDFIVYKDRPYTSGKVWLDVPPNARRMNQGTALFLLWHIPNGLAKQQFYSASETTAVSHLRVGYDVFYNEKNNAFQRT